MKRLFLVLIALFCAALAGCSWFDSDPIEPKIIGTGNLQYDADNNLWSVVIDSTQYTITKVTIRDHNPRSMGTTQSVSPVEGMLVTAFTSPKMDGVQAVTGTQSVEDIEELYRTNDTSALILFGLLLLCVIGVASRQTEKIPEVKADK